MALMDINKLLADIRGAADELRLAGDTPVGKDPRLARLLDCVASLDNLLSNGNVLPLDWSLARRPK